MKDNKIWKGLIKMYGNTDKIIKKIKEVREDIMENKDKLKDIVTGEKDSKSVEIGPKTLIVAGAVIAGVAYRAGRRDGIRDAIEVSVPRAFKAGYEKAVNDIIGKVRNQ